MGWLQSWLNKDAKLFRFLLYAYPAEFRHEYGAEMERLFADRLKWEPRGRLWLESLSDVAVSAAREHWNILLSDLRYGARVLAASPGFSIVALLVIALGIGAATAIFSLVNAVLLRSLPYGHASELVYLWSPNPRFQGVPAELGPNIPDFYDWQRLSHSFESMTMLRQYAMNLVHGGKPSRVNAARVAGTFFVTLEAKPQFGRAIDTADDRPGYERVAVISHAMWLSLFGGARSAIGKEIQLNRENYTVIGIMPPEFGYPFRGDIPYGQNEFKQTDIWLPAALTAREKTVRDMSGDIDAAIGRLRPGVSPSAAESELKAIEAPLSRLYAKQWQGWTAMVKPVVQTIVGPVEKMLWLLLGAVGLVLLIAISNVANLLLAKVTVRAHEMGIRAALGAGRARLVRQLLTESLLLSCLGGALGIALAYLGVHLMVQLNPGNVPRFESASVDGRVLFVAVALSVVTGLLCGLAPTLAASRASVGQLMKEGGGRGLAGTSNRRRHLLIVVEVSLSVVLLAGATLLIRSYLDLAAVNPGFSSSSLTFEVNLDDRYNTPQLQAALYKRFLQKLKEIPGVTVAGASGATPLDNFESVSLVDVKGTGKVKEAVEDRSITPDYRKALGTSLVLGRDFTLQDVNSKTRVVMVNQSFVKAYFHGRAPLGQQVRIGMGDFAGVPWSTVVGVLGDIRQVKLEEAARPQIFGPADNGSNFAIRSTVPRREIVARAREALRSLDPTLSLQGIHTMSERISESNSRRRFETTLLSSFAAFAVLLALVGLYGLMTYAVKQRTSEIGVRLAVGASRWQVLSMILTQGLSLTMAGLVIGLISALALTRFMSSWLFGVKPTDPLTFLIVPLFILLVATGASLIPAWNATRIDPVQALRQE